MTAQKLYSRYLRVFALTAIVCFAFLVVCDHAQDNPKDPEYEFVPVN